MTLMTDAPLCPREASSLGKDPAGFNGKSVGLGPVSTYPVLPPRVRERLVIAQSSSFVLKVAT